jgi:glucose-6-phosphate isomerase
MIDVTQAAGFRLAFDPFTQEVVSEDGFTFGRVTRTAGDLRSVLSAPDVAEPGRSLYSIYYLETTPPGAQALLDLWGLTYSPVLLLPGDVGGEFVKTSGHYHPPMAGSRLTYPEVYTGLYGTLRLFLHKRNPDNPRTPLDCALVTLKPGTSVMVPPEYAHVLINTSDEPALMAGLYSTAFKPDYSEVNQLRGLAYYIMRSDDDFKAEVNPCYVHPPELERIDHVQGTRFESIEAPGVPVWTAFSRNPEKYALLSHAPAAEVFFNQS